MRPALLAVAVGGALGALLRWGLGELIPGGDGFPWTTFAINVSGSFLLALLPAFSVIRRRPVLPLFFGTGMLGGYTTLSTYAEETRALLANGEAATALTYLLGTLAACLLAVSLAQHWSGPIARAEFEDEGGDE